MNSELGYWQGIVNRRLARRRALFAAGTLGLTAGLALVGCGGGEDKGAVKDSSGLVSKPVDTTAKAVKGGIYTQALARDVATFDANGSEGDLGLGKYAYSRMTRFKAFKYPEPVQGVAEGDAVTGWEVSPDGLRYTYKLRPNLKFDPRPPTNGRALTSADVIWSWERFVKIGTFAANFVQSKTPTAPFISMEAPDATTVVVKVAYPYAPANIMLGYLDFMSLMPVEAEDKFDPKKDVRGSAAWRIKDYLPSARIEYVKNPDWYGADKVNFDGITNFILPEYAAGLAQFRTGNLATFAVRSEDIIQTKKDLPSLHLRRDEEFSRAANWIKYSLLPDSPFNDARVRQAVSMLIDRDLLVETLYNVSNFTKAGLEATGRWHTAVPAGEEWWLDPKTKEFGDSAKFYKYDPAEAKKLIGAAGVTGPIKSLFQRSNGYAGDYIREADVISNMLQDHGDFQLQNKTVDHASEFRPKMIYGLNQHEGLAYGGGGNSDPDVDIWLEKWYRGAVNQSGWPKDANLDAMLDKQKQETDAGKRAAIVKDIQRYVPTKMHILFPTGAASTYTLSPPWLGNAGVWRSKASGSPANETWTFLWNDASKKG